MKVINKLESYPTGDMIVPYCPNCDNPTYSERKCPFCNTELEYEEIIEKDKEIERLNNIIKHIENICESSIASIDNYLLEEKETKIVNGRCTNRNGYQIERLKAYRTKSKEILGRIKELKGSDKK